MGDWKRVIQRWGERVILGGVNARNYGRDDAERNTWVISGGDRGRKYYVDNFGQGSE